MAADTTDKVRAFFAHYSPHTYPKGHVIIQAGSAPSGIFYMEEGQVNQYDIAPSGNQVIVNSFKPGAFFPMSWAINNTPNRYFFETGAQTTLRLAPQKDSVEFLHANPDVMFDLLARVYRGTDSILRRLAHLMGGSARSRLLFELISSAYRFGTPGPNGIALSINEGDLAQYSGLARETVSRTLGRLKDQGLVVVDKRSLLIPSIQQLETALGDDL